MQKVIHIAKSLLANCTIQNLSKSMPFPTQTKEKQPVGNNVYKALDYW